MKRFLRGAGIALMCFNGIGFAAVLLNLPTIFRNEKSPLARNLMTFFLLLAVYAGFFLLGYKLRQAGMPADQGDETEPAPKDEPSQKVNTLVEKTSPQMVAPPAPEPAPVKKELPDLQPQPTVHDLLGLPEDVEITSCPFKDRLEDVGPDGLYDKSRVALWLRPCESADAAKTLRALAECLKQIEKRAAALEKDHFTEYWSITKRGNHLYVLLVDSIRWLDGVPTDVLALCRENEQKTICVAMLNDQGMYDLVTGTEYTLGYQEWMGSADDAATYGEWWLKESMPAVKPAAVPSAAEKTDKSIDSAESSIHNAVETYNHDALIARVKESIRADKENARSILTSEEAFLKAIHEEGLDQKFDFKMNNDYARDGSIRLNRLEDGSYELYHVGERGIDARERFQDPFEAFYTTRQWLRRTPLADFSSADNKQNIENNEV